MNSSRKNLSQLKDSFPAAGASVAIASYYQGAGIPVIWMNRMRPRPLRGPGWRKGGVYQEQEFSR